jgi:hypothetical protein
MIDGLFACVAGALASLFSPLVLQPHRSPRIRNFRGAVFLIICAHVFPLPAAEPTADGLAFFHDTVVPILEKRCYECHSHAAKKAKGGLVLDSRAGILKGGDFGPALVPGDPAKSLLLTAVGYGDADLQMPPKEKLPDAEIAHLRRWIELGAPDPRAGPEIDGQVVIAAGGPRAEDLWSVQPLVVTPPPAPRDTAWPRTAVDRFLLAALEEKNLAPSPDAAPHTLLRRLHDLLTGLPPTPEETARFIARHAGDPEAALAATVDALLASPHFGERWARHWLDVARYADVGGSTAPEPFHEGWRYRGYVIDAFNGDKPWDRFVREQIAGDLLPAATERAKAEQAIATGFLGLSHVIAADRNAEKLKLDTMDELVDVIGKTFLGIQIGCARCHDHKIDPVPTRDYYSLAGIMRSTDTLVSTDHSQEHLVPESAPLPRMESEPLPPWLRGGEGAKMHAVRESKTVRDEPIHLRGEQDVLGPVVPRGFPTLVKVEGVPPIPPERSGREQLAEWLLAEDNVLAARVIVNRVWHHVFGAGLVRSTDNFGLTGESPSHPTLLDWLAHRFRHEHGGRFKALIRELALSRAFRQASAARADAVAVDPQNRLRWRAQPRRRDAESLLDASAFVAGALDLTPSQFNVPKFKTGNTTSTANLAVPPEIMATRLIYWPVFRKDVPIAMDLPGIFDFPPPTAPRGQRALTVVPAQSLALLNSPRFVTVAAALADSLPDESRPARVAALYFRVLARMPTQTETADALAFVDRLSGELVAEGAHDPVPALGHAWTRLCHALLVSNEFLVLD